jgi:hypothetical protein
MLLLIDREPAVYGIHDFHDSVTFHSTVFLLMEAATIQKLKPESAL